ncbi:glycosyltransferase family 4 protein [Mesorhizobium sp. B263B2A]|uniref:glycosyltransferase family 4 protein n=1 Tax=Mesorhizobium sp. B263B2A TaxID=2876669 RepID=UPI001CD0575A|nr:glycosyltransferase family 4 protein [Mesorhizobium sp. B263B2A]MCA0032602.1 glycosyltransferase family 4 protein [Mesorhizobium sp. B263B2A]
MHLLFATSIVPDGAPASGYEIANAAIIAALRRAGARVTVIGFIWPGRAAADPQNTVVLGAVDVRTENASALQKLAWVGKAMLSGLTFASVKLRAVSDSDVLAAIERAGPFDGYVLNSVQFAGAFEKLFEDRPSIFVAHNVEHLSARENAAAVTGIFQRLLFRREASLLEVVEERLCRQARFVFTLAEEDRAALGVASDDRSAVLPLVTGAKARKGPRHIDCDAALIGTWTWQPNRIGLDWFLDRVVPHLRPDFRIRIAGSMPSGVTSAHPGVEFVGRVPDAQAFVRAAAVIPLVSIAGSGVQLKTIETFELGLPSVATSRSLRGIGHRPANCIVTDDPASFARALEAAAADIRDVDGSAFHREQIRALDAAIRLGLEKIGVVRQEAFA